MFVTFITNRPGLQRLVVEINGGFGWSFVTDVIQELLLAGFTCSLDLMGDQTGLQTVHATDLEAALGL